MAVVGLVYFGVGIVLSVMQIGTCWPSLLVVGHLFVLSVVVNDQMVTLCRQPRLEQEKTFTPLFVLFVPMVAA